MRAQIAFAAAVSLGNAVPTVIAAAQRGPDIVITAVSAPAEVVPGLPFNLTVTARNAGSVQAPAGWFVDVFHVQTNSTRLMINPAPTARYQVSAPMPAGVSVKVAIPVTLSATGRFDLNVVADATGIVPETDETNNRGKDSVVSVIYPTPKVTSFSPTAYTASYKGSGDTITFTGTSFVPEFFTATVAGQPLRRLAGGTSTVISFMLPSISSYGALVVSHGHPTNADTLDCCYRVYRTAIITSITPSVFQRGQMVTIAGTGLFPGNVSPTQDRIKIGGDESHVGGGAVFVRVTDFATSINGQRATFIPQEVWSLQSGQAAGPASPQPTMLSGALRLRPMDSPSLTVVGPSVTWKPAPLMISNIAYPAWGSFTTPPPFLLTSAKADPYTTGVNELAVTGTGFFGATAAINGQPAGFVSSSNGTGTQATLSVPYGTTAGYVVLSQGIERAQTAQIVNIISGPQIDVVLSDQALRYAETLGRLIVDSTYVLRGSNFLPASGASGLTIGLFPGDLATLQGCSLQFKEVSHTASEISFRFTRTADAEATARCLALATQQGSLRLNASYGGINKTYWYKRYYLTL